MQKHKDIICVILGGGGHARVLIDSIKRCELPEPYAILDADSSLWGGDLLGISIMGGDELLPELIKDGVNRFAVGLGSIGDNGPRRRLFELGLRNNLHSMTIVHPSSICSIHSEVGSGSQLFPGSIVNAGTKVGLNVVINTGAIVEHDCILDDHVYMATGAKLCGSVHISTEAFIGAGAVVSQAITIGEGAIVGAGAMVLKDVPPNTAVGGVPARPIREVK